jgi:hypothetical protein
MGINRRIGLSIPVPLFSSSVSVGDPTYIDKGAEFDAELTSSQFARFGRFVVAPRQIGNPVLQMRYRGQLVDWQFSPETVELAGVAVPTWVQERRHGVGGPDMVVKVEVRDGTPEIVRLSFEAKPGQGEVREKHLRAVDVDRLASDLYATFVAEFGENPSRDDEARVLRAAEKFVERQRLPRDYRVLTDEVLRKVAEIYRANVSGAPTKAVARHFRVKDRMASTYVDRARKAGYLPPTKQGQKKA